MNTTNNSTPNDTETRIIEAAKALFIEKGYAETSMSDIAARAGINRPALHYYFRTKDKMFHAVIGGILAPIVPHVYELLMQKELPISMRMEGIIDAYYHLFSQNPRLPMFIVREINRDTRMLLGTLHELQLDRKARVVIASLEAEMDSGRLNRIPIKFLFMSFYGLLVTPLLMQDAIKEVFLDDGNSFEQLLLQWKPYILKQILTLLQPTT